MVLSSLTGEYMAPLSARQMSGKIEQRTLIDPPSSADWQHLASANVTFHKARQSIVEAVFLAARDVMVCNSLRGKARFNAAWRLTCKAPSAVASVALDIMACKHTEV